MSSLFLSLLQRLSSVRQSVIVIASLVGKAPNLAGLTRTCEIFQAEALMVADLEVLKDREFESVAVTVRERKGREQKKSVAISNQTKPNRTEPDQTRVNQCRVHPIRSTDQIDLSY